MVGRLNSLMQNMNSKVLVRQLNDNDILNYSLERKCINLKLKEYKMPMGRVMYMISVAVHSFCCSFTYKVK